MIASTVRLSSKGQIVIPKDMRDSFHWDTGAELLLVATERGVMLQSKSTAEKKISASALRGFLQYKGKAFTTEELCKPVEYSNDHV
jgi:AbrB family looped-hinge helix DNA binding protein